MKVINIKTNEEIIVESREFAEMFIKLSVKINNERNPIYRDNKKNYIIAE